MLDTDLAETIVAHTWFTEGPVIHREPSSDDEGVVIDRNDWRGLGLLHTIASNDLELAREIAETPWYAEGPISDSWGTLWSLHDFSYLDVDLARAVLSLPWLVDRESPNHVDLPAMAHLMGHEDPKFAKAVFNFDWVKAGVSPDENQVLFALSSIVSADNELGRLIASYPWVIDDMNETEIRTLHVMGSIAATDTELAQTIVNQDWFIDGLTDAEFVRLALNIPNANGDLIATVNVDEGLRGYLGESLTEIARGPLGFHRLRLLGGKPWVADGIDNEEAAFITAVSELFSATLYDELLDEHYTQSKVVSLPLAGDVNIWVFSNESFAPEEDVPGYIEEIIRISEDFLGVPFPTTDIILLAIARPDDYPGFGGNFNGRRMQFSKSGTHDIAALPQATGFYYLQQFPLRPRWIRAGVSGFVADIVFDRMGKIELHRHRASAASAAQSCMEGGELENISHLAYVYEISWEWHIPSQRLGSCSHSMGRNLLHIVYETIGEEAMSSVLRDFLSQQGDSREDMEGMMYRALLDNAPVERKDALQDIYRTLHGGYFAFQEVAKPDDHGGTADDATAIILGETVQGNLDYFFDFDYYRFRAEEGQKYRLSVAHETLHATSLGLFNPHSGEVSLTDQWEHRKRTEDGPEIVWVAPHTNVYYFAVRNFGGETGEYTVRIVPVEDSSNTSESDE